MPPSFNPEKFTLGTLCRYEKHDYMGTGQSLRRIITSGKRKGKPGACVECEKANVNAWQQANPEKVKTSSRAWYDRNKAKVSQSSRAWQLSNPEKYKELQCLWYQKNKDRVIARTRAWQKANPEQFKKTLSVYQLKNRDRLKRYGRSRYELHRDHIKRRARAWYAANQEKAKNRIRAWAIARPEKIRLYGQAYRKRNPGQSRDQSRRRRDRKATAPALVLFSRIDDAKRRADFNHACAFCGTTEDRLSMDHFLPLSLGNALTPGNTVPACRRCNSSKNNRDPFEWYRRQPFFSQERWDLIIEILGKKGIHYGQMTLI